MSDVVGSEKTPCLCDICGVDTYDPETDATLIGLALNIRLPKGDEAQFAGTMNQKEYDRVLAAFGKTEFNICFVCFLTALGVKRKED